jgi:hypothetical protein
LKHISALRSYEQLTKRSRENLQESQEGREVSGKIGSSMLVCFCHVTYFFIIASQKVSYTARIYRSKIKLHNMCIRTRMIL